MASQNSLPAIHSQQQVVTTSFLVPNLHCPTCITTIESSLARLSPKPLKVSTSILSHSVSVSHDPSLSVPAIRKALEDEAFEIYSIAQNHEIFDVDLEKGNQPGTKDGGERLGLWSYTQKSVSSEARKTREKHVLQCGQCQAERWGIAEEPVSLLPKDTERDDTKTIAPAGVGTKRSLRQEPATEHIPLAIVDSSSSAPDVFRAFLAIGEMTCSACVGTITEALGRHRWIRSVDINLLTNSAIVLFEGKEHLSDITQAIEDLGYEAAVEHVDHISVAKKVLRPSSTNARRVTFSISGMTCSSCVGNVTKAVQQLDWVENVEVSLISNSATVIFKGEENLQVIRQAIEDVGYGVILDDVAKVGELGEPDTKRTIVIHIRGMYCSHCPMRISEALNKSFGEKVYVERLPTMSEPILRITYTPHVSEVTIRHIMASISTVDAAFEPSIYHPPSLEQRSQEMRAHEQRRILFRLTLSIIVALPTFIMGIVLMTLVGSNNPSRRFVMKPVWAGSVTRAEWALFIMATPVYFFAADIFHIRTFKELRAMWRPRSTTPLLRRFYRFGSMNMLISLGTTIAYFSSIAELAIAATKPAHIASIEASALYFDSVVFLTMFLLIGRFIEAYSKAKTGDAVISLGKLRPIKTTLVDPTGGLFSTEGKYQSTELTTYEIPVDLLEVGDVVKVFHGSVPPSDGIIVEGETQFDEASLTGESRLVTKRIGDEVFAGTVNKANPISVRISNVAGTSLLDQIIKVVREGQARRAPIERVADLLTSHFVPLVIVVGISTWIIWLALGLSGILPESYRNTDVGGWPLWSLRFSIAVFVVACPCGIGLAAPTALFVGGGLAAQHGILVKGGGEAFQEASKLDCIVFDKTGTLTEGGEPSVTDYECLPAAEENRILGNIRGLEESSSHPIAKALVSFSNTKTAKRIAISDVTEVPGKGMQGNLSPSSCPLQKPEIILGNEALMSDYKVQIDCNTYAKLGTWKAQGKSVALFASKTSSEALAEGDGNSRAATWKLSAVFAVSDKLRPEAAAVVTALKARGIEVWMISGDNSVTARAVGKMVGISEERVIAGVLPDEKAEKIQYLQKTSVGRGRRGPQHRSTVAMIGDGINDAAALTMADVGIAVGSGSDVAISSAEFVLMSSCLTSVLVLIDLSQAVFRRVLFNFGWALVYNLIALPIAAGVLYPVVSKGSHIRLDPIWASLAMALSSVSVVCSSLLLRSKLPGVGFRCTTTVSR